MNPTFRKHARIGIVHFMAFPEVMKGDGPIVETLSALLEDVYFDAVEITKVNDPDTAREVRRRLESSAVTVGFGAQPVLLGNQLNLNATDKNARQQAVDAVRGCMDQAADFGATGVAVLAGPFESGAEQDAEKALIESLTTLSREAQNFGLELLLEIFDDRVDKKSYVGKWPVALRVGEAVEKEAPNFGLMHDLSHLPILGENASEALPPLGDLLRHIHIGNAVVSDSSHPAYGDQHPRFGLPGGSNGVSELSEFLAVLYEIGYLGGGRPQPVAFEVKPMAGEDSGLVVANAKRTLDRAVATLDL